MLFNSKQKINSITDLDENQLVPIDFSRILESAFDQVTTNDNHKEIIGTDFTIEFYIDKEPTSNFMLQLYGENGIYELIELSKKYGWQIYDSGIDSMIDLENPTKNGYENHKKYVAQIMKRE